MIYEEPSHDELLERTNAVNTGHEAGQRNLPRPDAETDPHEGRMRDELLTIRDRNEDVFANIVRESREAQHRTVSYAWRTAMEEAVRDTAGESERALDAERMQEDRLAMNRRRQDLTAFRNENERRSEPVYHDENRRAWGLVILFAAVIGESVVNAMFLAEGSAQGLLGGWMAAIGFAALNVLVPAFLWGPALRYVNHVKPRETIKGWAAGTAWVFTAVCLNLVLGHYREASAAGGGDLGEINRAAWSSFTQGPFGMTETTSWLVALLGMFLATAALLEGYRRDDPYPGYGRKHREFVDAHDEYLDRIEETTESLEEIRGRGVGRIEAIAQKVREQEPRLRQIRETRRRSRRQFNEMLDRLEAVGNDVITEYREANHAVRTDGRIPEAHRRAWTLGMERIDPEQEEAAEGEVREKARVAEMEAMAREACEEIRTTCERNRHRLRNEDERRAESAKPAVRAPLPESVSAAAERRRRQEEAGAV